MVKSRSMTAGSISGREEERRSGGENGWSGHRNARYKRFPSEGPEDSWMGSRGGGRQPKEHV
jgi:hypothetical protein